MTWEELKEEAKKMGAEIVVGSVGKYTYEKIIMGKLCFYSDILATTKTLSPS